MTVLNYIEYYLGRLFYNYRARDSGLFRNKRCITSFGAANMSLTSSDYNGPSPVILNRKHVNLNAISSPAEHPELRWTPPPNISPTEYLLISEDPDAPVSKPIMHSCITCIRASRTFFSNADLKDEMVLSGQENTGNLNGGDSMVFVGTRRKNAYIPPKPLMGHGPHRYFWTIVALKEELGVDQMIREKKSVELEDVARLAEGKVVGWGEWVGSFERTWNMVVGKK